MARFFHVAYTFFWIQMQSEAHVFMAPIYYAQFQNQCKFKITIRPTVTIFPVIYVWFGAANKQTNKQTNKKQNNFFLNDR